MSVRLLMVVVQISSVYCAVYSGAWCPHGGSFFPVHRADTVVSCAVIVISCAETLNNFVRKREVSLCRFFLSYCRYRLLLFSLLFFSFSAKEEHVVKGKIVEYFPLLLSVAPMERIGGWSLAGEDPKLFTQDQLWKGVGGSGLMSHTQLYLLLGVPGLKLPL